MSADTSQKEALFFMESQEGYDENEPDISNSRAQATAGSIAWGQFSSNSESLQSLDNSYTSSKNTLTMSTKELHEKNAQNEKRMKAVRLLEYMKNFETTRQEESPAILRNPFSNQIKRIDQARLSLGNVGRFPGHMSWNMPEEKSPAVQHSPKKLGEKDTTKPKKVKNVSLGSQFRRKSCHCSECGGLSKLEIKVQNIVKAPNRELYNVRHIRHKNQQKKSKKRSTFLNLPNLTALVISNKESQEGTPRSPNVSVKRSNQKSLTSTPTKTPPVLMRSTTKEFPLPRRGNETPLRKTRNSIELEEPIPLFRANPSHYIIKIFTPADTERHIVESNEALQKKEEDLLQSLITAPVLAKKAAAKKPKKPRQRRDSTLYREEPASPSHSDYGRSSPRALTWRDATSNRPKVVVKKYVLAPDRDDDSPDEVMIKKDIGVLDQQTKKVLWEKIGMASPKFKAIFGGRIDEIEPIREYEDDKDLTVEIKQEAAKTSRDFVKKIYADSRQLPKVKIPNSKGKGLMLNCMQNESITITHRTNSNSLISPKYLEKLRQNTEPNVPLDDANSFRLKTEPSQQWYSIYAAPKTTRNYTKPLYNLPGINSQRVEVSSIMQNNSSNIIKGHKTNLSLKDAKGLAPVLKQIDKKINPIKRNIIAENVKGKIMQDKKLLVGSPVIKMIQNSHSQKKAM